MKNDDRSQHSVTDERDHDTEWRDRIQRALRDLRSVSSTVEHRAHPQTRAE